MDIIKKIRKDIRETKNRWVFTEYEINGTVFETKRYNYYFQIFREKGTNKRLHFPIHETEKSLIDNLKIKIEEM